MLKLQPHSSEGQKVAHFPVIEVLHQKLNWNSLYGKIHDNHAPIHLINDEIDTLYVCLDELSSTKKKLFWIWNASEPLSMICWATSGSLAYRQNCV